jgi:tetratricopeptide (TPR) repeat protein
MKKTMILIAFILSSSSSPSPSPDEPPSKHNKYFSEALSAQKNQEYEAAIQLYQSAISEKQDDADAWNNMGYCYRMTAKGYLDKAGNAYAKAISYNPQHEAALEYQGEYFVMVGQLMSAYRNYQALEKIGSDQADKVKAKLDSVLEEAQAVLKIYSP